MIGDPTGQNTTRPPLTLLEVEANAKAILSKQQKFLILKNLHLVNNNDWLGL